jgi:hypothetical protein
LIKTLGKLEVKGRWEGRKGMCDDSDGVMMFLVGEVRLAKLSFVEKI